MLRILDVQPLPVRRDDGMSIPPRPRKCSLAELFPHRPINAVNLAAAGGVTYPGRHK